MSRFFSFNKRLLDDLRWIRGASHDGKIGFAWERTATIRRTCLRSLTSAAELHILLRVALDIVKIGPDAESVGQAARTLKYAPSNVDRTSS